MVQRLYREYVSAVDSILRPDYMSLAAETNLIRVAAAPVYDAVVTMVNAAGVCECDLGRGGSRRGMVPLRGNSRGAHGWAADLEWPLLSERIMLATIGVILLIAWLLGFVAFNVGSGLIHILLVIAVVAIIMHFIRGRGTTVV